jgi:hypothetical protein
VYTDKDCNKPYGEERKPAAKQPAAKQDASDKAKALREALRRKLREAAERERRANQPSERSGEATAQPSPAQPQERASAAEPPRRPDTDPFVICDRPDKDGVQACYEVPPKGLSCVKHIVKNDDIVWSDRQPTCESTRALEARNRNAVANKPPPPNFGEGDRQKESALSALSGKCRAQLNALLEGANRKDGERAYMAYGALRAECDSALKQLARAAATKLPERRLSTRARSALDQAMGKNPEQVIGGIAAERKPAEAPYDMSEVLAFGGQMLNQLAGLPGIYVPPTRPAQAAPTRPRTTTYGQGAPTNLPKAPRQGPSDITGLGK